MPSRKSPRGPPVRAGPLTIRVHCETYGCRAVTTLHFDGREPYLNYTRGAKDWISSEDEEERVSFLCPKCSEPIRRDIANDQARQELAWAASLPRTRYGGGEDSGDDDVPP